MPRVAGAAAQGLRHVPGLHGGLLVQREGLLHRDVDVLAFAGAVAVGERGEGGDGADDRGGDVALAPGRDVGRVLGLAGEPHHAAHGDADDVGRFVLGVGAGLAEAGDGGEDDAGAEASRSVVAEAEGGEVAGGEALDDDVGGGGELLEGALPAGWARSRVTLRLFVLRLSQ